MVSETILLVFRIYLKVTILPNNLKVKVDVRGENWQESRIIEYVRQ